MIKNVLGVVALCALLGACTVTSHQVAPAAPINWSAERSKRVVVMDPDVELSELTAGGVTEARADWTATARAFIKADIADTLAKKTIDTVVADPPSDPHEVQLVKLHSAVGNAILINNIVPLPTKGKNLDWTLGPGVSVLGTHYSGDYALFIYVRDSYTTAGRAALMVGAAMFGVSVPGGRQIAFASLVDLRSGRIVWFNQLASSTGNLKEAGPASDTVAHLLDGLPL